MEHLIGLMESEIDLLKVEKRIRKRVKDQMEKSQREHYLNEQMKAIQKELGELEGVPNDFDELTKKLNLLACRKRLKLKLNQNLINSN